MGMIALIDLCNSLEFFMDDLSGASTVLPTLSVNRLALVYFERLNGLSSGWTCAASWTSGSRLDSLRVDTALFDRDHFNELPLPRVKTQAAGFSTSISC